MLEDQADLCEVGDFVIVVTVFNAEEDAALLCLLHQVVEATEGRFEIRLTFSKSLPLLFREKALTFYGIQCSVTRKCVDPIILRVHLHPSEVENHDPCTEIVRPLNRL